MNENAVEDFRLAFRNAVREFLAEKRLSQAKVARGIGITKQRFNSYCREKKPAHPEAEVLYFLCAKWGFSFEYRGYIVSAATLEGVPVPAPASIEQQIPIDFEGQFKLTDQNGALSVTVKRPSGRLEVSLSLDKAVS